LSQFSVSIKKKKKRWIKDKIMRLIKEKTNGKVHKTMKINEKEIKDL